MTTDDTIPNTLALYTEFTASVSADSLLTVSSAMKLGPAGAVYNRLSVLAF